MIPQPAGSARRDAAARQWLLISSLARIVLYIAVARADAARVADRRADRAAPCQERRRTT
jgi:hypothetical protein